MKLYRLLLVLALLPVTAYSGMPLVGCRCSNGELRLHCPKLGQLRKATATSSDCCKSQRNAAGKSCCCGSQACHGQSDQSGAAEVGRCSSGCKCTAVALASDVGPILSKVITPEPVQVDLFCVQKVTTGHSHEAFVISKAIDTGPIVAMDFVIAYERLLI